MIQLVLKKKIIHHDVFANFAHLQVINNINFKYIHPISLHYWPKLLFIDIKKLIWGNAEIANLCMTYIWLHV